MPPYMLVVESDPDLQRRISETLREASYEVATETDAAWAKRSLLIRPPDGVVLDTSLSDGSGFSVADDLRKDPETRHVPIFFVATRHRGAAHRTEARRRFGPAEYLPTPLDVDTLLAQVLEALPPKAPAEPTEIPHYPKGKLTATAPDPKGNVTATAPVAPARSPSARKLADTAQRREKREVEAAARSLSGKRKLRGSLAREPFASLLRRIYAGRMTGALLLAREDAKKIVYFQDGYPISARSNLLGECLGQILLGRRLITRDVLDESLRRMRTEGRQQGQILIEMGVISPHSLSRALVAQMEQKLYEVFAWRDGTFTFSEGKQPPGEPVRLDRTPAAIILEGIRRHYDPTRRQAVLARFAGQYVVPSADPLRRLQDMTADPVERRFIEGLDGSKRLEALLGAANVPAPEAQLLVVAMAEAGMIEPARTPAKRVVEESTRVVTVDAAAPGARPPDALSREELAAMLEALRAQSYFEVLGVAEAASGADVDRAYEARARDFHPDRFRHRPEDVRQIALRIFDRLGDAQLTLRDATRRRRYASKLERERAAQAAAPPRPGPSPAAEKVYYAGVEHLKARRYREAVEAFRQALRLAPGQAGYHGALGWAIYRAAPTDPTAIQAGEHELQRAVEMNASDPWVRISLGRFFAETRRPDQAITEFEAALQINPGLTDVQDEIRRLAGDA